MSLNCLPTSFSVCVSLISFTLLFIGFIFSETFFCLFVDTLRLFLIVFEEVYLQIFKGRLYVKLTFYFD